MIRQITLLVSFVVLSAAVAMAQSSEVFIKDNMAIGGYDPVAFFKESKPVMGNKEFTHVWNGGTWYFSTKENLETFKKDPARYTPQYGGYCAYGTAEGHKAPTQPDTWSIVNGKLYFNYNKDVQKMWNKDQKNYIEKADKNWPDVKKE